MTVTYGITKVIYTIGNFKRISYGIAAFADAEIDGTASVVAHIPDITTDKEKLSELVHLCNSLELSTVHLNDVVENFLVSL